MIKEDGKQLVGGTHAGSHELGLPKNKKDGQYPADQTFGGGEHAIEEERLKEGEVIDGTRGKRTGKFMSIVENRPLENRSGGGNYSNRKNSSRLRRDQDSPESGSKE